MWSLIGLWSLIGQAGDVASSGGGVPNQVWAAAVAIATGLIGALTGVYVRRDNRAGAAETANTNEHGCQAGQWADLTTFLTSELKKADDKCQRQLDEAELRHARQMSEQRAELLSRLDAMQVELRSAWAEIARLGGHVPPRQD